MRSTRFWFILSIAVQLSLVTRGYCVTEDEILGIWRPELVKLANEEKKFLNKAPPELELRSNGRFELVNIPKSWSNVFGQPAGKISGAGGTWRLIKSGSATEIHFEAMGVSMVATMKQQETGNVILLHIRDGDNLSPKSFARKWKG